MRGQSGIRKKYILKERAKRIGVIDVGGGQRAVYGAGVFDRCLDLGVQFDAAYGISAGSANVTSYLAGQRGRNHEYFCLFSVPCLFSREEAKIVIPETVHDFGRIESANGSVKHVFAIKNEGVATLELIRISSSCRCIVVEWSEKTVEPGRTAQLEVTYNPVGQSGTFKHEVQVFSNGSEAPLVLTVKRDMHEIGEHV